MAKKPGKLDKHGHNFVIFSQATGQTWNHTSAYHLSTLEFYGRYQDLIEKYRRSVNAMVSDSFPGQFLFNM